MKVQPFTEMGLKGGEILRLLRNGVLDMSATLLSYVGGEVPEAEAIDLAGITRNIDDAHKISDAYKPVLAEVFEERYGVKLLAIIPYHAQIAYCRQPIASIEDFDGLKVRASGRSQGDMIEALGGIPVGMAFGEVVPALEKGVVDWRSPERSAETSPNGTKPPRISILCRSAGRSLSSPQTATSGTVLIRPFRHSWKPRLAPGRIRPGNPDGPKPMTASPATLEAPALTAMSRR